MSEDTTGKYTGTTPPKVVPVGEQPAQGLSEFKKWWCSNTEVTGDERTATIAWDAAIRHIVAISMRCVHATTQVTPSESEYYITITQLERICKRSLEGEPRQQQLDEIEQQVDDELVAGEGMSADQFLPDITHCFRCKKADNLHAPDGTCPKSDPTVDAEQFYMQYEAPGGRFQGAPLRENIFKFAEAYADLKVREATQHPELYATITRERYEQLLKKEAELAKLREERDALKHELGLALRELSERGVK